jgi:hypothetical protein
MTCGCGCATAVRTRTPVPIENRPGLPALSSRVGDRAAFLASMTARLSSRPALDALTTREPDDPAIALLDGWAVVADVLTFYQERIANEGYLRTATEPESLARLGRLVDYRPRPPLGASTYLAYTLDPGATGVIPAGSGARSVPAQGQLPQVYETSEELTAREEWNALAVRRSDPPDISAGNAADLPRLDVAGTAANLRAGDRLLFRFPGLDTPRVVQQATADFTAGRTRVRLSLAPPPDPLAAAVTALDEAIRQAGQAAVVQRDPVAGQLNTDRLLPLAQLLSFVDRPDQVTGFGIGAELRRLAEAVALARQGAPCARADWLDGPVRDVLDAGAALLALAADLTRTSPDEIAELRRLSRLISCGEETEDPPGPPCADPAQAVGLVGLTAILPALRRPPSRPPRNATALNTGVAELFRPDSDVHPRLLIAADPRLGPRLYQAWASQRIAPPPPLAELLVMRIKAVVTELTGGDTDPPAPTTLVLDAVYDGILPGEPVIATDRDGNPQVLTPAQVSQTVRDLRDPETGRQIGTAPATTLDLDADISRIDPGSPLWAQGQPLAPVGDPIAADVGGASVDLARNYPGLRPGRFVVVSGERTDVPFTSGVPASELAMVAGISQRVDPDRPGDTVRTTLRLANPLAYTYQRDTVTIAGNVVAATQGETRDEVLGSGDAGQAGQTFRLRQVLAQTPLTWLPADNPLGAADTLTTRVNGLAWQETEDLAAAGPTDHQYLLVTTADGGAAVRFGDGAHGARLPTGSENVTARYRTGAGASGNTAAGTITQLAARPLGVNAVTNPLPATGGADGDRPGDARATIPLRTEALDRLVSVADYAGFTRARAGIGKASATKLSDGVRELVHVTIAGIGDVPIDPLSGLFGALEAALADFGDLAVPVRVEVRELLLLVLSAGIKVLPEFSYDLVAPAVREALLAGFGFAARELAQPAYLSAVVAAMQRVPGVDYVDVDVFQAISAETTPIQLATIVDALAGAAGCIPAAAARFVEQRATVGDADTLSTIAERHGLRLAELVALNPDLPSITLPPGSELVVARGIRPAQLAVFVADLPETVTLRRIP